MKRFRFSIASLLLVVLFVAVAVAALRASTDTWDGGVLGLVLLSLTTAVLLAVHRTDLRRAYWLGFALFGWTYLVASLVPAIESRLPTTKALAYLDGLARPRPWVFDSIKTIDTGEVNWAHPAVNTVAFSPDGRIMESPSQGMVRLWDVATGTLLSVRGGSTENFVRIGHSLLALLMAFAGGHLSRSFYGLRRSPRPGDTLADS